MSAPLIAFLELDDCRLHAVSFSESGLTLLLNPPHTDLLGALGRGERALATLVLQAGEHVDRYQVSVRLATRSSEILEVALIGLPAQARLRLRHARHLSPGIFEGAEGDDDSRWLPDRDRSFEQAIAARDRRFVMDSSRAVWEATQHRKSVAHVHSRPVPAMAYPPEYPVWLLIGSIATSLAALVIALYALLAHSI